MKNPVTEPKRSQKSKRPLSTQTTTHRYSISGNALKENRTGMKRATDKHFATAWDPISFPCRLNCAHPAKRPSTNPTQIISPIQKIAPNQSDPGKKPKKILPNQSKSHPNKAYPSPKKFRVPTLASPTRLKFGRRRRYRQGGRCRAEASRRRVRVANVSPTTSFRPLPRHSTGGIPPQFSPPSGQRRLCFLRSLLLNPKTRTSRCAFPSAKLMIAPRPNFRHFRTCVELRTHLTL